MTLGIDKAQSEPLYKYTDRGAEKQVSTMDNVEVTPQRLSIFISFPIAENPRKDIQ